MRISPNYSIPLTQHLIILRKTHFPEIVILTSLPGKNVFLRIRSPLSSKRYKDRQELNPPIRTMVIFIGTFDSMEIAAFKTLLPVIYPH